MENPCRAIPPYLDLIRGVKREPRALHDMEKRWDARPQRSGQGSDLDRRERSPSCGCSRRTDPCRPGPRSPDPRRVGPRRALEPRPKAGRQRRKARPPAGPTAKALLGAALFGAAGSQSENRTPRVLTRKTARRPQPYRCAGNPLGSAAAQAPTARPTDVRETLREPRQAALAGSERPLWRRCCGCGCSPC